MPLFTAFFKGATINTSQTAVYQIPRQRKEIWKIAGLQREDGGYGMDCYHAHVDSYLRSDKWGSYDVTGTKNSSATLTLDLSTQQYIASPTK